MANETNSISDFGAERSVEDLSRRYRPVLLRYFMRRRISADEAQDLVQEVFTRLAKKDTLDDVGSVDGYLFTVAASVAMDFFRYRKVRALHPAGGIAEQVQRTAEFDPERVVGGRQELDLLLAALNGMPERMRNIFILARLESLPRSEIAHRLGVSKRTVELQITLATACLAEQRRRMT